MKLIIFTSCIKSHPISTLTVECKDKNIEVVKGTYNWDFGGETVCADSPNTLVISDNMLGDIVVGGEYLELYFDNEPEEFDVRLWEENEVLDYSVDFNVNQYQIESSQKKGEYVLEVVGKWERGMVTYVMKILVE